MAAGGSWGGGVSRLLTSMLGAALAVTTVVSTGATGTGAPDGRDDLAIRPVAAGIAAHDSSSGGSSHGADAILSANSAPLSQTAVASPTPGTAPGAGPRTATGCTGDGTSGKRVQVIYAVSPDTPDRYAENLADFHSYLQEVDSIFQRSAAINGGGTRQVRWVHDADCRPVITKMVVPAILDNTGAKHQVYGTLGDTYNTLKAAGLSFTDQNRKYVVLVDYPGDGQDDPTCGIAYGRASWDTSPSLANANNAGGSLARVDTWCWWGTVDSSNWERHSVVAHELAHTLGAILPGAPNVTESGHCTDNADLMCYEDTTSGPMREVCAPADVFENLLDCNGDDYFNTNPPSSSWLATHWNVASSSFLYAPGPPALTASTSAFVPGLAATTTLAASIPSGQGWRADYTITQVVPYALTCALSRTSSTSGDPDAVSTRVQCPAGATQANLQTKLTQEDGQTATVTTRLTAPTEARTPTVTVTASASSVTAGTNATFTAQVTDPQTRAGVYGIPVRFTIPAAFTGADTPSTLTAVTNPAGTATVTATANPAETATTTVTATTDTTGIWQTSTAATTVTAVARPVPTSAALTAPTGYVTPGATASFTATLTTAPAAGTPAPVADQPVTLWRTSPAPATQVAAAATGTDGRATLSTPVTADSTYELRFAGTGKYDPSTSAPAAVAVTRTSTLGATTSASTVPAGTAVTVTATLTTPGTAGASGSTAQPGRTVTLWYRSGSSWNQVAAATTTSAGVATFAHTPAATGAYQARFAGAGAYTPAASSEVPVTVQQPATLTLTLPGSAPYGSTVTATGRLTSGGSPVAGRPLHLWRGTGAGAALVATSAATSADGTAAVTFTGTSAGTYQLRAAAAGDVAAADSPTVTFTPVRSTALATGLAGTSSTAGSTIAYGQPITITGTLTSTSSGASGPLAAEPVELWVTSPGGVRTRVGAATTNSTGTVTFTVTVTGSGTYQLTYAGTPTAAAATGTPTPVTVTRATTAVLALTAGVGWNTTTTVTATLTWAGTSTGVTDQPVELWATPATAPGAPAGTWSRVATATTSSTGTAAFPVTAAASTLYQVRYPGGPAGSVTAGPAASAATTQHAVRATTAAVTTTTTGLTYGQAVTVTGTLTWAGPGPAGAPAAGTGVASAPVELWGHTAGAWSLVARGTTDSAGRASWTPVPQRGTTYQLRHAGWTLAAPVSTGTSGSNQVTVTVARATAATLTTSATRVVYGTKVTVTGTLTWAGTSTRLPGVPVELWGYATGKWTKITTGTTNTAGTVSWVRQPWYNTAYQLRSAGGGLVADTLTKPSTGTAPTTKVIAKVSLATPTKVRYYATYTLKGAVAPAAGGRSVAVVVNGRVVARATTNAYGQWAARVRFPKGYSTVYANVATHPYNDGANSAAYRVYSY